ncbi:filamentous hemagglutinin N-terminal domain-containing protein [Argonema antarcticum]|uniref:two-partner secretion domain-containing protein n=1 Tax=Argonema antarcticum TaxID=2942763 RepID=UPI0020130EE1|nr:filamentous hemagglutinin N-terminal domain-containing protein [Argonema antarcticum]MCL1469869.1 filamentous hemagglutinin N-terminal domain-containing protein [Argonema antarcticum A004/B2]
MFNESRYNPEIVHGSFMQERSPYAQVSLQACPKVSVKFWLASGLALFYLGWGGEVRSQIAPDGTLSTNVTTPDNLNFTINDGNRAGNNLFHSFREFSVPTGGEAFFNNAVDIQNIFSRVTGISISNIDGLIRANGAANLFLINPNGIIFGPNARLNIGGSFLGSTANSIKFGDGIEFSATNPQISPLLSINVPMGLQYGNNPGEIRVQGKGQELGADGATESFDTSLNPLEVTPGKNLTIVGGNVIVDGGILQAPGGRLQLGGLAGEGTVGINADGSLSFPEGVARGDVSIINKAGINVLAGGGGSIAITGRNIDISGDSLLSAGIATGLGSRESIAGDIELSATEGIAIDESLIQNNVTPDAVGNSGNISSTAKSLLVTNGAQLDASTYGQGNAGSVTITASDTATFDGERKDGNFASSAGSSVQPNAVGDARGVSITAKSLLVTNGAQLDASTFGQGNAGSVTITATDTVTFDGESKDGSFSSGATSTVQRDAVGDAGGVSITAKSLFVTNGAYLDASTFGQGKGGSVTITASDTVTFDGEIEDGSFVSGAYSTVASKAVGDAGGVSITAKSLFVTNGAQISANTFGRGKAGSVTIAASDTVTFDGESKDGSSSSAAASGVQRDAVGDAGGVSITAKSLFVTNGAQISASTFGRGKAGSVTIAASDTVTFDGESKDGSFVSRAGSLVAPNAVGNAGGVSITAKSVFVTNGARLDTNTIGQGNAGTITITASDTVTFDGESNKYEIPSGAASAVISYNGVGNAVGNAGGVSITAKSVFVTNGAGLDATTSGQGNAGSITITASDTVTFDGLSKDGKFSSIAFSSVGLDAVGDAGGVSITAKSLFVTNGAALSSSSFGKGAAGDIVVDATDIRLDNQALISSNTVAGEGDIKLNSSSLILRQNSRITTNATGSKDIGGGNIILNTGVLAALENSDITANAQEGKGGEITINAQAIFGAIPRTGQELQLLLNTEDVNDVDPTLLETSDITAISQQGGPQFEGTITVNTPDVDPSSGLLTLPDNLVDATRLVASSCRRQRREQNQFIVTGRGGLPPNPIEGISDEATWIDLTVASLSSKVAGSQNPTRIGVESTANNSQIVEAQGWTINSSGQVELVAQAPTATLHSPSFSSPECNER